jgi:hypothetical protein
MALARCDAAAKQQLQSLQKNRLLRCIRAGAAANRREQRTAAAAAQLGLLRQIKFGFMTPLMQQQPTVFFGNVEQNMVANAARSIRHAAVVTELKMAAGQQQQRTSGPHNAANQ